MERTTEIKIGETLFIVTEEFSQTATETAEQKLKKLIARHPSLRRNVIRKLSDATDNPLAIRGSVSQYGQYQTETGGSPYDEETS